MFQPTLKTGPRVPASAGGQQPTAMSTRWQTPVGLTRTTFLQESLSDSPELPLTPPHSPAPAARTEAGSPSNSLTPQTVQRSSAQQHP